MASFSTQLGALAIKRASHGSGDLGQSGILCPVGVRSLELRRNNRHDILTAANPFSRPSGNFCASALAKGEMPDSASNFQMHSKQMQTLQEVNDD
jgi:predicted transglutaminase-like cysteine proteinase